VKENLMSRVQLALRVSDLEAPITFYRKLLAWNSRSNSPAMPTSPSVYVVKADAATSS
jgi:hypothetical protein